MLYMGYWGCVPAGGGTSGAGDRWRIGEGDRERLAGGGDREGDREVRLYLLGGGERL